MKMQTPAKRRAEENSIHDGDASRDRASIHDSASMRWRCYSRRCCYAVNLQFTTAVPGAATRDDESGSFHGFSSQIFIL
jgi:hypothetical protein